MHISVEAFGSLIFRGGVGFQREECRCVSTFGDEITNSLRANRSTSSKDCFFFSIKYAKVYLIYVIYHVYLAFGVGAFGSLIFLGGVGFQRGECRSISAGPNRYIV
ncbi:unnamed protein product [Macrosiphum euphorbiae]|uniref:Transmembrane protein n=1 Tax=Macrosiphum euphorbiae TaxID=13131 RepID=A0AAV0X822_9HEMI|nr:unnamed protein product [Macrosiphum euphorbiae]